MQVFHVSTVERVQISDLHHTHAHVLMGLQAAAVKAEVFFFQFIFSCLHIFVKAVELI